MEMAAICRHVVPSRDGPAALATSFAFFRPNLEASLNPTVTIVLPVHNAERILRGAVMRVLDMADIVGRRVRIVVVDDGSTDGTYETACELSRLFPQVIVLRHQFQRGLAAALEQVRLRLGAEHVVAHDGLTPIDLDDLAELLTTQNLEGPALSSSLYEAAVEGCGSRRLAAPLIPAAPGSRRHRGFGSFRWLRLDEPLGPRRRRSAASKAPLADRLPQVLADSANAFTASPVGAH